MRCSFSDALKLTVLLGALLVYLPLTIPQQLSGDARSTGPSDFFGRVIANQKKSEIALDDYARTQRVEKRRNGSDPDPWSITCWRLFPMGTGVYKIALGPDGKPTDGDGYRSELEKLEKYLAWVVENGPSQKEAYARAEHKQKERFELMDATHKAFRFELEGKEARGNRMLIRYAMTPNPNYRPTSRNTVLFTKVRGTIWIDEQSSQLAKVEGSVTEDFSIGLFLARVYKGSHFMQERYEIAPGVWEPTFEQYDFDGRKFVVGFSIHERTFYFDYKRVGPPKEALEVVRAELSNLAGQTTSR